MTKKLFTYKPRVDEGSDGIMFARGGQIVEVLYFDVAPGKHVVKFEDGSELYAWSDELSDPPTPDPLVDRMRESLASVEALAAWADEAARYLRQTTQARSEITDLLARYDKIVDSTDSEG